MKKKCFTGGMIVFVLLAINSFQVKSQTEIVEFIQGGIGDGEKLIQAYLEPLGNGMGANLNGGWYNTAKVHRTLGFDITFTITTALVPESATIFDVTQLELQSVELKPGDPPLAPTFAGGTDRGPALILMMGGLDQPLVDFNTPGGVDVSYYPMPMIKGGVGLPGGIEVNGRFMPSISYEDMNAYLWGVGVKYDVLQHFRLIDRIPFLNASLFGAYTIINFSSDIDFQKSIYGSEIDGIPITGGQANYDNQRLDINMQGFTTSAILSYDLPVITVFGGVGYSRAFTTVGLLGDYPMINSQIHNDEIVVLIEDYTNPVNLEFDNFSGLQTSAGLRLKLAVVTLHAKYTRANYNLITAGLGISIR